MQDSRTNKSFKNMMIGMITLLVGYVMTFLYRKFFLMVFDAEYLGASSLFASVLQILSLAELGFGAAIMYCLYKPLAEKDYYKVALIIKYFQKIYLIISGVVLAVGLGIMPLMPYIIKDAPVFTPNIYIIYTFYVIGSSMSYFGTVKMILLRADQQDFITKIVSFCCKTGSQILILVLLLFIKSFYVVLVLENSVILFSNLLLTLITNKKYPYLKSSEGVLDKSEKRIIKKHTAAMFTHKVGGIVLTTTDNILISACIGIGTLGIYSNYSLIVTSLNGIIGIVFTSVTASLGEFVQSKPIDEQLKLFDTFNLVSTWISVFGAIGLYFVSKPFLTLWLGKDYVLGPLIVLSICMMFFCESIAYANGSFTGVTEVFHKTQILSVVYAVGNVVFSLLLIKKFQLAGVFYGTVISRLIIFPVETWMLYKYHFRQGLSKYWAKTGVRLLVGAISVAVMYCASLVSINNVWGEFFYMLLMACLLPNAIFILCFYKTKEFKRLWRIVASKFARRAN